MIWIGLAWKWVIGSMLGRIVAGAVVGLVALGINNSWQRKKGAEQVITSSIQKAKAINERNARIREKAKQPGAFERLLRNSCRDCD